MFTGLITGLGELVARDAGQFVIASRFQPETIAIGASIACDGCCLTVTKVDVGDDGARFHVDVSEETFSKTTLAQWSVGHKINLERALKVGDELGGHLVTGHVDGVAKIIASTVEGDSQRFEFEVASELARFVAQKGSVALNGTSLTVNAVADNRFTVNLIPHTLTHTTWARKKPLENVNIEVDMFARYIARMMELKR